MVKLKCINFNLLRKVVLFFLFSLHSLCCIASGKVVVNIGYIRNNSELVNKYGLSLFIPETKTGGVNFSVGTKNKYFENGLYYGIGYIKQYTFLNEGDTFIVSVTRIRHNFGTYSNFFLTSLFKDKNIFTNYLHIYTIVKIGGYYIHDIDNGEFKPHGIGFNCFTGLGASYYFLKKFGIFGEVGYDYYPVFENYVKMSKITYRVGISLRM